MAEVIPIVGQQFNVPSLNTGLGTLHIPFDVICSIMEHSNGPVLRALSLMNRSCNAEANKHLWKSVVIRSNINKDSNTTLRALAAISRDPLRARYIEELLITIIDGDGPIADLDKELTNALIATTRLRALRILILCGNSCNCCAQIWRALSSTEYVFRLSLLETQIERSWIHELFPFLERQSSIRTWNLHINGSSHLRPIPSHLLPNLESVAARSLDLKALLTGRPVHSIDLGTDMMRVDGPALIEGISSSTVNLRSIRMSLIFVSTSVTETDRDNISSVASALSASPGLRRLEIYSRISFPHSRHKEFATMFPAGGSALTRLGRALSSCKELEELVWTDTDYKKRVVEWGGRWNFVDKCRTACPSLVHIVINGDVMDEDRRAALLP